MEASAHQTGSSISRAVEYQALRQFVRLSERAHGNTVAAKMNHAIADELTPRQRQMVDMYYIDQKRMSDIARELGISISSVSRTLKRARQRLRRCLRYGGRALLDSLEP